MDAGTQYITLNFTIDGDGIVEAKYPTLTFPTNISIATVKENIRKQFNISAESEIKCVGNNQELNDLLILENTGLVSNDIVKVIIIDPSQRAGPSEIPANVKRLLSMSPDAFVAQIIADPQSIETLLRQNPTLAQAVLNNDVMTVAAYQQQLRVEWGQKIAQEQQRIARLEADPFNTNNQARIMEEIRLKQVQENYQQAIEHMPESFARVVMLYIPMKVEGTPVIAFVDSGAQSTIISRSLAEKTGIFRLLDRRYAGVAQGVGQARILGRIHMANIQFGNLHISCSFQVMDDRMEFLFGLDMLRRYQACIDLQKNCLRIGTEEVSFLSENEIPKIRAQNRIDAGLNPESPRSPVQKEFPDEDIKNLVSLGFTEEQVLTALRGCEGNVDYAASFLYQKAWNA